MAGGYDRFPTVRVPGHEVLLGYDALVGALERRVGALGRSGADRVVLACDSYPGVRDDEVLGALGSLRPEVLIDTRDLFPEPDELTRRTLRLSVERIEAGLAGDSAGDQGRNG